MASHDEEIKVKKGTKAKSARKDHYGRKPSRDLKKKTKTESGYMVR